MTAIKIKRSGTTTAPASLAQGELAYSYAAGSHKLFVGTGIESAGSAANIEIIGGSYYTDMLDHTAGTLTANSAVVVDSDSKVNQFNVDDLRLDSLAISVTKSDSDLELVPNGTGTIKVPSGYTTRTGFTDDSLATKAYVDNLASGLTVKSAVRLATSANINLMTALVNGQVLDSVVLVTGDRILVKDQTTLSQNGIYVVGESSGVTASRADDANTGAKLAGGSFVFVESGTHADSGFVFTHDGEPTLGTSDITATQFSGAGSIVAGAGITKIGNTLAVNVDGSSIETSGGIMRVKEAGITNAMLAGTISTTKIDGLDEKIQDVTAAQLTNNNNHTNITFSYNDAGDGGISAAVATASTSAVGLASFSSSNFAVTEGGQVSVTAIDGGTF